MSVVDYFYITNWRLVRSGVACFISLSKEMENANLGLREAEQTRMLTFWLGAEALEEDV